MKKHSNGVLFGLGAGLIGLAGVAGGLALAYKTTKKHNLNIKEKFLKKKQETCECCGCEPSKCFCDCCNHDNELFPEADEIADVKATADNLDSLSEEELDTLLRGEELEPEETLDSVKLERDHWKALYDDLLKEKANEA